MRFGPQTTAGFLFAVRRMQLGKSLVLGDIVRIGVPDKWVTSLFNCVTLSFRRWMSADNRVVGHFCTARGADPSSK